MAFTPPKDGRSREVFHGRHFETRTDGVGLLGVSKRGVRRTLLATLLAIVFVSFLGSFGLSTHSSGVYTRYVGTDQERVSPTKAEGSAAIAGRELPKSSSADRKPVGPSREDVGGKVAALRKGELLLSVPRLDLRNIHVPSGSTQTELDREGIIRLKKSGLPSYESSNTYIAGHRIGFPQTRMAYVFYELDKLRPRDRILVEDHSGTRYVYEVYDYRTVPPTHYWLTHQVEGKTIISLQTCTPIPSFENRLIVMGELVSASSS